MSKHSKYNKERYGSDKAEKPMATACKKCEMEHDGIHGECKGKGHGAASMKEDMSLPKMKNNMKKKMEMKDEK